MFQKFTKSEISGQTQTKSSVARNIKGEPTLIVAKILAQYPMLQDFIDELIPKKQPLFIVKCLDRVSLISVNDEYLFFQHFDGDFYPTLKVLHKYPDILPKVQIDRGGIKFVLKGADIMCPGMTSPGGRLPESDLPKESIVAVYAEGKEHALAVGVTKMSIDEMYFVSNIENL